MLTYSSDACGDLTGQAPAAAAAAPQIIGQPVDQLVSAGDFASFSVVVAVTSGVTFQWAFNGTNIAGATGDSLLLASVGAADVGQYSVIVTNSAGMVTSTPATLTLDSGASTPSPRLHLAAYSDVGGSVTVTPFQRDYGLAEPVTLTATASAPSQFAGWSGISTGDLLATTSPVIVMMTADITVRARFAAPVPLAQGMVAFWRGEHDATDLIGGNSGTFYTGTTPTTPSVTPWGKVGSAFAFTGTNYVQVPDAPGLQPPQLTVEAWVFPTVLSRTSYQTVIGRGSSTIAVSEQWSLGVFNGIPQIQSQSVRTGDLSLAGPAAIPLNEWTHLAATFDGATMVLFVNGIQVASQGGLGALAYAPVPVGIGATWQNNAPACLFTGFIDEVSLYDRALSRDEIFDIYNADSAGKNVTAPYFTTDSPLPPAATNGTGYTQQLTTVLGTAPVSFTVSAGALPPGMTLSPAGAVTGASTVPGVFDVTVAATDASGNSTDQLYVLTVVPPVVPPPGLVSWWRGEPTTSAVVLDSIDGNNGGFFTGTTAAAPSYTPDGEVGGAFAFDGTTYVQIPDAPSLRPPQLTLEMWVYPTVLSTSSQTVIGRGDVGVSQPWSLNVVNGIPVFMSHSFVRLAGPAAIPLGEWTHLAATFDGATMALFVNGIQVASQGGLGALVYGPVPVPVTIGAAWLNSAPDDLFTGRIDEVSLYDRALTPVEISGIVAAGPAGKSTVGPYITTGLLLPAAVVGQPYTHAFTSMRGTPPVSYTLAAASAAPPGLTLTSAGVLSGTPTASGVFGFTVVATDAAALSDEQPFTLQAYSQPVVTGISPASGPLAGRGTVTVTGSSLTGATGVTFGSAAATILPEPVPSDTQLTVTSPSSIAIGAADVRVTTPGGTSATSAADQFTYLAAPVVTGVSPASGPLAGGITVTVIGSGLIGATGVSFVPVAATILPEPVPSDTKLTVTCPASLARARAAVDVTVTTPGGTSATSAADQFTYLAAPVVTGVSPASGPLAGRGTVTVTGSSFTGATGVSFGSAAATILPEPVPSDTQLTVTCPAATASGTLDVTVTTPGGTSATSAADQFTYGN